MDFKTILGVTARGLLNVVGGALAGKFALTCSDLPASTPCDANDVGGAIGGLLLIGAAWLWSFVQKQIAARKLEKAIAAPAGKAE